MVRNALYVLLLAANVSFFAMEPAYSQGETTSAIVGRVSDITGAPVPGAGVTVTHKETGLKRFAMTDESGRFNFPQLKPGI
jgi:protocatechuate 3,4-dioxygenase beta subunit